MAATAAELEPSYKGRPLSEWLADVRVAPGSSFVGYSYPPEDSIRAMGTNAIAPLLRWISYERSVWDDFPPALEVPHTPRHTLNPDELADTTSYGFRFLGAVAVPAIPELARLARTSSDHTRAERCSYALAGIGPEAVATLCCLATNGPFWVRYAGAGALQWFCREPEGVRTIPTLIKCLEDTNTYYSAAGEAVVSLMNLLQTYPASTLPALTNALGSPSAEARLNAIRCLSMFEDSNITYTNTHIASSTLPALRAALRDPDSEVRNEATNILHKMDELETPSANKHLQPIPRRASRSRYGVSGAGWLRCDVRQRYGPPSQPAQGK
ncbi:MAG: HEAT repeat domain-containing protein [Verrucomicrobiota bacterium]